MGDYQQVSSVHKNKNKNIKQTHQVNNASQNIAVECDSCYSSNALAFKFSAGTSFINTWVRDCTKIIKEEV